jgi:hypothetical protein
VTHTLLCTFRAKNGRGVSKIQRSNNATNVEDLDLENLIKLVTNVENRGERDLLEK